jgi:hypothetical protein
MDIFACGEQTPRQNDAVVTTPITTEGDSEEVRLFDCVVFAIIPTDLDDEQIYHVPTVLTLNGF